MRYSSILLSLAAAVSAIDIRGHYSDDCVGGYEVYANSNPNVCCGYGASMFSVSFVAIPSNWRIRCTSYTGGDCSAFGTEADSNGATYVCLKYTTKRVRTGGSYTFIGLKRAEDQTCPAEQATGKCEAVAKPNAIGLADGTEYNITGLSDDKVEELRTIAASGAGADSVPAEFQVLRR